jgi:hypothetical protein
MSSSAASSTGKVPLTRLPLPAKTLQQHLTRINLTEKGDPDPTPSVDQRRSRTFAKAGHWARVTPLPISFPYRLPKANESAGEKQIGVEDWLKRYDNFESDENGDAEASESSGLKPKTSQLRSAWRAELLGVSEKCLEDSLPHLDVGNALAYTGQLGEDRHAEDLDQAGQDVLDIVSGRRVMVSEDGTDKYGPWSSRYAGESSAIKIMGILEVC